MAKVKELKVPTPNVKDLELLFKLEDCDIRVVMVSLLECKIGPSEIRRVSEDMKLERASVVCI